jgi:hypothetical protein
MQTLQCGRGRRIRIVVVFAAVGLVALTGCEGTAGEPPANQSAPETLLLPPIGVETMDWMTTVQTTLSGDPNFGAVAIDDTRSTVTITWFGDVTPALGAVLAEAPEEIEIVVQPADFSPGELQALVSRAMEPGAVPGVQIAIGYVRNDASGLDFGIVELPANSSVEDVGRRIGEALQRTDVPINVEVSGAVVPLSG